MIVRIIILLLLIQTNLHAISSRELQRLYNEAPQVLNEAIRNPKPNDPEWRKKILEWFNFVQYYDPNLAKSFQYPLEKLGLFETTPPKIPEAPQPVQPVPSTPATQEPSIEPLRTQFVDIQKKIQEKKRTFDANSLTKNLGQKINVPDFSQELDDLNRLITTDKTKFSAAGQQWLKSEEENTAKALANAVFLIANALADTIKKIADARIEYLIMWTQKKRTGIAVLDVLGLFDKDADFATKPKDAIKEPHVNLLFSELNRIDDLMKNIAENKVIKHELVKKNVLAADKTKFQKNMTDLVALDKSLPTTVLKKDETRQSRYGSTGSLVVLLDMWQQYLSRAKIFDLTDTNDCKIVEQFVPAYFPSVAAAVDDLLQRIDQDYRPAKMVSVAIVNNKVQAIKNLKCTKAIGITPDIKAYQDLKAAIDKLTKDITEYAKNIKVDTLKEWYNKDDLINITKLKTFWDDIDNKEKIIQQLQSTKVEKDKLDALAKAVDVLKKSLATANINFATESARFLKDILENRNFYLLIWLNNTCPAIEKIRGFFATAFSIDCASKEANFAKNPKTAITGENQASKDELNKLAKEAKDIQYIGLSITQNTLPKYKDLADPGSIPPLQTILKALLFNNKTDDFLTKFSGVHERTDPEYKDMGSCAMWAHLWFNYLRISFADTLPEAFKKTNYLSDIKQVFKDLINLASSYGVTDTININTLNLLIK